MLNRVILIGRLTYDPELRYTPNGIAVGKFNIAVERPFANAEGKREADFIDIVTWRKLAENCTNHLGKGRLVAVEGRLQIRTYESKDGQRHKVAEVVADSVQFLDWPKDKNGTQPQKAEAAPATGNAASVGADTAIGTDVPFDPDEVPF